MIKKFKILSISQADLYVTLFCRYGTTVPLTVRVLCLQYNVLIFLRGIEEEAAFAVYGVNQHHIRPAAIV
jgi:hypothetical protein